VSSKLIYVESFLPVGEAGSLFDSLKILPWTRGQFMGKAVPRDEVWIGPFPYKFSGRKLQPHPIKPEINKLQQRSESEFGDKFNSVLLNKYQGGKDSVDWHSDDEPEMDDAHSIASISVGAQRKFLIREKGSTDKQAQTFVLANGSLIIMPPGFQETHEHCVPKMKEVIGTRINLTFRRMMSTRPHPPR
jgi:2OG-Fe(II) oxygenase superfamily